MTQHFMPPAQFAGAIYADAADAAAITARFDAYMAEAEARFAALEAQEGPYTVERTLKAYDDLAALAYYGGAEAYSFSQTMDTDEKRQAGMAGYTRLDTIGTRLGLSRAVYDRLCAIDASGADEGTQYYLRRTLEGYERSGVSLPDAEREQVRTLQEDLTRIGAEFARNIANARLVVHVLPEELAGLPQDWIDRHPVGANGLVEVSTDSPDLQPVMAYADDARLRERLMRLSLSRAYPENSALLGALFTKRQQLAELLGRADYATLVFEDRMLNTPAAVEAHLADLALAAAPSAAADLATLNEIYGQAMPGQTMDLFNQAYASRLARMARYDLDPQDVRRYFTYDNVRDGILALSEDLFAIDIRPWDTPLWHPDVEAYEVYDGGALLGQFYLDSHPRPGKYKHANHIGLRRGVKGESIPVSVLTMNLPAGGYATGLLEHGQIETFLHEYGHLLHNILGGRNQRWFGVSGVSNERDFTEAPSQMLENWVYDYDTLARFARNEAGETIPRELVNRMQAARWFGAGLNEMRQLGLSNASLRFHQGAPEDASAQGISVAFREYANRYALLPYPETTHMEAAFGHLDGYSAGYYTYGWSRVISADLFARFEAAGLRDPATAMAYRRLVLEPGGSKPAADLIEDFLGRPVKSDAFARHLRERG
ncbi:peptidase M3 [Erythrobacter arachoides]|uniref:Peptidase M3 n=1 Tax=Aurantiacibacter arachoides TaxID=1850444 RepID=A0A845A0F1_9SPHN|nr:M3 family metallopeptidase [Aurantiacibacter arachoides]MXO93194.1 peptidase M3 [Aurantiacibacter arachoides]